MMITKPAVFAVALLGFALIGSPISTAEAGLSPPPKKTTSQNSSKKSSRSLKPPTRSVGALKASYNGRYDAPNRTIDAQRARRAERLARPDRVTRRNARNEVMENGETTTSSSGTQPVASPVNAPQLRPARPRHRVSIDGLTGSDSVAVARPRRVQLGSDGGSESSGDSSTLSNWNGGTSSTLSTSSTQSDSSGIPGFDGRSQGSRTSTARRFSWSSQSSASSAESDGVDRLAGEGARPPSVELNRIRREPRWYNPYKVGNAGAVLNGERTPGEDGS